MWNFVDDKKDNEGGRAPLEYLPRGPRESLVTPLLIIYCYVMKRAKFTVLAVCYIRAIYTVNELDLVPN